jgi:hypothetical protein
LHIAVPNRGFGRSEAAQRCLDSLTERHNGVMKVIEIKQIAPWKTIGLGILCAGILVAIQYLYNNSHLWLPATKVKGGENVSIVTWSPVSTFDGLYELLEPAKFVITESSELAMTGKTLEVQLSNVATIPDTITKKGAILYRNVKFVGTMTPPNLALQRKVYIKRYIEARIIVAKPAKQQVQYFTREVVIAKSNPLNLCILPTL